MANLLLTIFQGGKLLKDIFNTWGNLAKGIIWEFFPDGGSPPLLWGKFPNNPLFDKHPLTSV